MQNPTAAPSDDPPGGRPFAGWLAVGVAGVGLLFVGSVHLPDTIKVPGLFPVGLAAIAGYGLGFLATSTGLRPTMTVAIVAWLAIAGGEVLSTCKTNTDRVAYLRTLPQYQDAPDHTIENIKRSLATEPEVMTDTERRNRQELRDDIERGEAKQREMLSRLTFKGFLKERLPKAWGKWNDPWPAVLWGAEILIGSTLGAWLTIFVMRSAAQRGAESPAQPANPADAGSGRNRG